MRLEGQSKLGYYPTPEKTLSLLMTWLSITGEGLRRYADPCCGKGEALAAIATAHGPAETYGIELSDVRAAEASKVLTHVITTGYEYAMLTDETFSLVLLNPPYDGEGETGQGTRMEESFLLNTTSRIAPGGILIYIIPHARINEKIARHLAGWYSNLRCFKLPDEEYDLFKQVIVFGARRSDYQPASGDALRAVHLWAEGKQVPPLSQGQGEYTIPVTSLKGKHGASFRFQYLVMSDEAMVREAKAAALRLQANREWRDLVPPTEPKIITPAMTPKKGHIGPQMLSGLLGTNSVTAPDTGKPLLLKGHIQKSTHQANGEEADLAEEGDFFDGEDKKHKLKRVELKEKFEAMMTTLTHDGLLERHSDPTQIGQLLEQHVKELAEVVQVRNVPRYNLQPEAWEWAVFNSLSRGRALPGRRETGLTDFQRHLAIAMGRLAIAHGAGVVNAEMASGKTTILLAVIEYLYHALVVRQGKRAKSPYPAIVVGPGIVTGQENWPKEIREVVPNTDSRTITVGVKPAPRPAKIGHWLKAMGILIEDETAFELKELDGRGDSLLEAKRHIAAVITEAVETVRALALEQGLPLSDQTEKALAASFKHTVHQPPRCRKGVTTPNLLDGRIGNDYAWLGLEVCRDEADAKELASEYSLAQFVREYQSGQLPEKSFAVMSFETAKLGAGRVPAVSYRHIRVEHRDEETDEAWTEFATVCACPHCGAVVSEKYDAETGAPLSPVRVAEAEKWVGSKRRFCKAPLMYFNTQTQKHAPGKWVYDHERGRMVVKTHDSEGEPYVCGQPLFQDTALRREAAARFALKKLKGFFGGMAVDEIHKCKAKGTGVGWVLQALNNVTRYTVGLTGTFFGGYSTSIFWLLYRLSPEVRREFKFDDEQRWAEKYGLLKSVFYINKNDDLAEDGTYTGTKHFETVSELPGISPAIVGLGLEYATFSSLKDIGLPLPQYSEEIVRIPLTLAMAEQIAEADGSQTEPPSGLLAWALNTQKEADGKGAISVWLNTALNRPDVMFRPEQVWFNRRLEGRGKYAVRRKELVAEFAAIDAGILPKEEWLAKTCQAEMQRGRKTLVYVRQTGTRDIQPRLAEILKGHGLRPAILRPTLAPAHRATWIKQNVGKMDVLLTNARLVEVGLNLTMFNTGIFFENEWSLYILWQAMRRLYRPGALLPVQMYFPVYEGTLEEGALNLLGAKMKAAQIFYGDDVNGALVEEEDESDLLHGLLRQALGQVEVGRAEGIFGSGTHEMVTDSPIGSPIAISPMLATLNDLWAKRETILRQKRRNSKGQAISGEAQLGLF